jgi:prolycopene isomerase
VDTLSRRKGKFFKPIFPLQYRKMWNVRNKTLADLIGAHVKDPELQHVLSALWGYYGLPPSKLSGFYYAVATGDYLKNGSYYIKNRSQDLSDAIADAIEAAGGKIIYDTAAERILLKNGHVAGVELSDGETLPASAVVSNASALTTMTRMLPPSVVPPDYMNRLKSYKPSISSFIVWLGLNQEIGDQVKAFSTHVSSGHGADADYEACLRGAIDQTGFGVCVYDNIFKGYSRPGTSTLQLLTLSGYEPWRRFEKDYLAGTKDAYRKQKDRWTQVLIKRAEEALIPGLSEMIEVKDAATPLTNRRYTGNTDGAIYGFEQSMDNAYMNRISNRTPVKGLYLAGAWGEPGGGFGGVFRSGQSAFQSLMEDWGS